MRWLMLLAVLGVVSVAAPAFAQGNDLYGPAGGRSTLMGNTGVALARDGSAPFYNPATIVRIVDHRLAFSAHFYSFGVSSFEDWHAPEAADEGEFGRLRTGDTSLSVSSIRSLPSSLCLFLTLEELASLSKLEEAERGAASDGGARQKFALCFASLESEDVDREAIRFEAETDAGRTSQVQALQRRWSRLYIGPTYSMQVDDAFAFGASLQVVYSRTSFGLNGSSLSPTLDGGGLASTLSTTGRGSSFDLVGLAGATYRHGSATFGVSVRAPALHLAGSYDGTFSRTLMGSDSDESLIANATGSFRAPPPVRIAVGSGFSFARLRFEVDAALSVPVQDLLRAQLDVSTSRLGASGIERSSRNQTTAVPSHVALHPSVGAEYFIRPDFSLMAGLSANFSALSSLEPQDGIGNLVQARASHVSAAFGFGSYWEGGEWLFGVQCDYGWGEALALDPYAVPNVLSVVGLHSYSLLLVVSGASSLRAIARVVDTITEREE